MIILTRLTNLSQTDEQNYIVLINYLQMNAGRIPNNILSVNIAVELRRRYPEIKKYN